MSNGSQWPFTAKLSVAIVGVVAAVAILGLVVADSFVPLATALIGAGSVIAGAWLAGRWQDQHTRTQLGLTNRSTAYLKLAEFLVRLRQTADTPASAAENLDDLADALDSEDWWTLQANVEVFGSSTVRSSFEEILTRRARLRAALSSWNEQRDMPPGARPPSAPALDKLEERRREVRDASRELLDSINAELADERA